MLSGTKAAMPRQRESIAGCSMPSAACPGQIILTPMKNLALAIKAQGRFAEAEPLAREALTTAQRVLGPEHPLTISFLYNFAAILFEDGRLAEAEKLYREALAIQARTLGPEHPSTLITKAELSDDLFKEGQVHEAER